MSDILKHYKQGHPPKGSTQRLWPLYGAGLENLGRDGQPIEVALRRPAEDELLVRHDACGLCFSDIKVIRLGQDHPRVFKNIGEDPVVLGHEVALTVVEVGAKLRDQYKPGDRFIVQAEIYKDGVNLAYGYMLQGGLSEYGIIDERILEGDQGNYLIPVQPSTGYAESALTEPWACVTAAYGLTYRTGLKPGGTTWVIGSAASADRHYTFGAGFEADSHPSRLLLTAVPDSLEGWLRARAKQFGIEVVDVQDPSQASAGPVDDLILLEPTPELIETASPHLADFGVCAMIAATSLPRKVNVDIGRVHYNRWVYVGSTESEISSAYSEVPVRASLRGGGRAWFVGAGGPMGRMHVQRALQVADGPATIVCTDVSDLRLADLVSSYSAEADAKGMELICLNPNDAATYAKGMARFRGEGFDDIVVLAPVAGLIAEAADWLASRGVMNVFAGVARGTMAALDLSTSYLHETRVIGHSASSIEDLRFMLNLAETRSLSPNRSVAAIGSLDAARDGLRAVMDTAYAGKIVIYPHIRYLPLTALTDLRHVLPTVHALLVNGREWTNEAEAEFLRIMLAR